MNRYLLPFALAVFSVAAPVSAQSVWDNGGPSGTNGRNITGLYTAAADFTFAATTSFDRVRFWDIQQSMFDPASFEWAVYSSVPDAVPHSAVPGDLLFSGSVTVTPEMRTAEGFGCCAFYRVRNDFGIAPVTLAAGSYYFALHAISPDGVINWETSNGSGSSVYSDDQNYSGRWYNVEELALELSATPASNTTTPEPASFVFIASGLAVMAVVRRVRER